MSKYFLVVGGTSGIGLQLVRNLSSKGHQVSVVSRATHFPEDLPGVSHQQYDVLSDAPLTLPFDQLHGVAYCPGSINLKPFHRLSKNDFLKDYEINILGAVHVVQQVLPLLKKATGSAIVLFSTVAVAQGMPFHTSVAAAKGAVEGLGKSLAAELAPAVRVNVIAPSLVDTPLAARLLSSPEKREGSDKRHPLKRIGTPEDLATMATFLLSEETSWITGQVFGVDGGMSTLRSI